MTTRRDILKGGAGIAAILASGKAPAYIVRSMLAARNGIGVSANKEGTRTSFLTFTALEQNVVINMSPTGTPPAVTLQSSRDGIVWSDFDPDGSTPITLESIGDKVFFRAGKGGNSSFAFNISNYRSFSFSGQVDASGDITSILDGAYDVSEISGTYTFERLFATQEGLKSPPEFPSISVADYSYHYIFFNCTGLLTTPNLPATELGAHCYERMFSGCKSIVSAPSILPATILPNAAYQYMFYLCTSLMYGPVIPDIESYGNSCFRYMFQGCTSLQRLEVRFSEWPASGVRTGWLASAGGSGSVFRCPSALDTSSRSAGTVPVSWTVERID